MALTGNCTHIEYTDHETDTTTETITDVDGNVETFEIPVRVESRTDYNNIYLSVKQIDNFHYYNVDSSQNISKDNVIHYRYAAYDTKLAKAQNQENFLFSEVRQLPNYDHGTNLYAQIYSDIKTIEGLTDLLDG
jgi:hypothetical protein